MRRWVVAGGLLALVGLPSAQTPAADVGVAAQPRLYGVDWQGSLGLVRVDRNTLRPLAGRRVPLGGEPLAWSFAPDRSRIVLGSTARGAKLRLIDLRRMRLLGDVRVARRGSGVATAWAGPRRVLAVVVTPGCCGAGDTIVAGVDAGRRKVVWRRTLGGSLQAGERFRRGLVLVLGPRGRSVGPSRLVQVGPEGQVRSAPLPEIRSGTESIDAGSSGPLTESWDPGLAVDRTGARAFVVQARAPLAEVDLRTFQARSHPLEPGARAADAVVGPTRHALWLGRGMLAVTGADTHSTGGGRARPKPAGLTLIDTRSWSARTIDRRTTDAVLASGTVLASSYIYDSLRQRAIGSGLTGYTVDGRRRYHIHGKAPITGVQPLGARALVGAQDGLALIDARTGRPVRRLRRFSTSLVADDAPFH